MVGIYKITSPSGRIYIGQSWDIGNRWSKHRHLKCSDQPTLYNSFIKYGVNEHKFEIVQELPKDVSQSVLDTYEIFYWQQHKDCGFKMLNIKIPGSGGKHSVKTIEKMKGGGNHFYGKKHSEETKKRISEKNKGKPTSDYNRLRTSQRHKGVKKTPESIKKMSESLMGHKAWNKGMVFGPRSEEVKMKISDSKKGRTNGRVGFKASDATKKKLSEVMKNSGKYAGEKNPNFGNKARLAAALRKRASISYSFGNLK